MHKPNIKAAYNAVKKSTIKHSPEILTGIGIAGMVTTTVMAVRATPKALRLINNAELEKANETNIPYEGHNLSKTEIIKVTWKCYIPAAITGSLSIVCLIGASSVNARRNAALATAYSIAETSLKEYQNKVVETIGEKKEQTIRDAVAKEKIDAHPVKESEIIELIALVTMAEAEGECEEGKRLVIDTILNRVDSDSFPNTVYEVVYQPSQFSSMWNGRVDRCYIDDYICQLVIEELRNRKNYDVIFFTADRYGNYGTPMFQIGNHYFSSGE